MDTAQHGNFLARAGGLNIWLVKEIPSVPTTTNDDDDGGQVNLSKYAYRACCHAGPHFRSRTGKYDIANFPPTRGMRGWKASDLHARSAI